MQRAGWCLLTGLSTPPRTCLLISSWIWPHWRELRWMLKEHPPTFSPEHPLNCLCFLCRESPQESTTLLWWPTASSGKWLVFVPAAAAGIWLTLWSSVLSCTSASLPPLWLTWRTLWLWVTRILPNAKQTQLPVRNLGRFGGFSKMKCTRAGLSLC